VLRLTNKTSRSPAPAHRRSAENEVGGGATSFCVLLRLMPTSYFFQWALGIFGPWPKLIFYDLILLSEKLRFILHCNL
jgi:hypothetical protein